MVRFDRGGAERPRRKFAERQMKLVLNKEYKVRHLLVAVALCAVGGWFFYDGFKAWPEDNAKWRAENPVAASRWDAGETKPEAPDSEKPPHPEDKIAGQKIFGSALCAAALLVLALLAADALRTLEWNENEGWMRGSMTGGRKVSFSEVSELDLRRWRSKRIARAVLSSGRKLTLDAWHHAGAAELVRHLRDTVKVHFEV